MMVLAPSLIAPRGPSSKGFKLQVLLAFSLTGIFLGRAQAISFGTGSGSDGDDFLYSVGCTFQGDGSCDAYNNNANCAYDGGDCCECDCISADYACGHNGFECLNPLSSCAGGSDTSLGGGSDGGFYSSEDDETADSDDFYNYVSEDDETEDETEDTADMYYVGEDDSADFDSGDDGPGTSPSNETDIVSDGNDDTEATGDASDARVSAAAPSTPALLLLLLVLGGSVLTDLRPAC